MMSTQYDPGMSMIGNTIISITTQVLVFTDMSKEESILQSFHNGEEPAYLQEILERICNTHGLPPRNVGSSINLMHDLMILS
jgi:hypothetical protein